MVPGSGFRVLVQGSWFRVHALAMACAVSVLARAQEPRDSVRVEASEEAMGTTFTVIAEGTDRDGLGTAVRAALAEAVRLDHLLSNYKAESEWSAMNREAARAPFVVSPELFELLDACLAYSRDTDGAFDVSVGPLLKAWGFFNGEGVRPSADAVTRALENVGPGQVRLDRATRTVHYLRPGVDLDPGGIGKGYAIDRMVQMLKARGVRAAFLSAGGSSIYGLGAPADEPRGWSVVIRHPRAPSGVASTEFLHDASLSTSGSYERFFRADGQIYSHIMDPRTGAPATGTSSVSVIAPRTIDSEAWTKAYFVNGAPWAARHRLRQGRVLICDDRDVATCQWIE
jgi:thiamine biosynthesis lipoprotein